MLLGVGPRPGDGAGPRPGAGAHVIDYGHGQQSDECGDVGPPRNFRFAS